MDDGEFVPQKPAAKIADGVEAAGGAMRLKGNGDGGDARGRRKG
jgi:hypothetical protein